MEGQAPNEVTLLLQAAANGDTHATDKLFPIVYEQLRALARRAMNHEKPGQTLEPTALVHEVYLRLVGSGDVQWNGRGHFFGAAAQAMRRILVERARRQKQIKRGGNLQRVDMPDEVACLTGSKPLDLVELDRALTVLEGRDKRKSDVVMLRYFAGLSVEETAAALGVSTATVKNDWAFARAWLMRELTKAGEGRPGDD